jgi:KaiC/GvpD/RAD55 family RecA-like ATPase
VTDSEQLISLAKQRLSQRPMNTGAKPSERLAKYIDGVTSGRITRTRLPWPKLDTLTNALMPGAVTVICGDPGVGKTYFLLDCLRYWTREKVDAAIYFLEEDDTFYLRRLLAQEEGNADYVELDWWQSHPNEVRAAMLRHANVIDELGACFNVATNLKQMELRQLIAWLEGELSAGRRVVAIDPITAAAAGIERWLADDAFMMEAKGLITRYGASLILVTHPRKGNVTKKSGHDQGGGAAYFRFSSANIWINRLETKKRFDVFGLYGATTVDTDNIIEIHKAREGKGKGRRIAMTFGNGLHFAEAGVVTRESDESVDTATEKPMRPDELKKAITLVTTKFPGVLNQSQGDSIRQAFKPFGYATVERVVNAYYLDESSLDIQKLIARLHQ